MLLLYTWFFPNKYATIQYQQAPQSIDAQLKTLYQQSQSIVGTNPTADLRPALQPLQLTMFNLNWMLRKAYQKGWYLNEIQIIDDQNQIRTIKDTNKLKHIFDPNLIWSFETWAGQLNRQSLQVQALTLSHYKALNSKIQIALPNQVSYSSINLKRFRPVWTYMVNKIQHLERTPDDIYYPMIIGDTIKFPDFGKSVRSQMKPRAIRRKMQRWVYDHYTIDDLPIATQISDHALTNTEMGSYVIIHKNKMNPN